MIRVTSLIKNANSTRILRGVSFDVAPQTVLGVIGASGSGKTTLLRCLNGLERINDGRIECGDVHLDATLSKTEYARRVTELRRKTGTVFQHLYLFPHLTVLGNIIEAPVHVLRVPREEARREALELLDSVGLKDKAPRYPESLSGGEQQRVAIARALVHAPRFIIADEPTGNLDPATAWEIMQLFLRINARGATVVMATHNREIVDLLRRRVIAIDAGQVARDDRSGRYHDDLSKPQIRAQ